MSRRGRRALKSAQQASRRSRRITKSLRRVIRRSRPNTKSCRQIARRGRRMTKSPRRVIRRSRRDTKSPRRVIRRSRRDTKSLRRVIGRGRRDTKSLRRVIRRDPRSGATLSAMRFTDRMAPWKSERHLRRASGIAREKGGHPLEGSCQRPTPLPPGSVGFRGTVRRCPTSSSSGLRARSLSSLGAEDPHQPPIGIKAGRSR
jgi:hypothetical protein